MPLDPVSTLHPLTGAIRPVTPTLLAETYLCPLPAPFQDADAIRAAKQAPWSASLIAAPEATVQAVSRALHDLIHAAPALDSASIEAERLPEGRARTHLTALRDLWRDIGGMPEDLAPLAHSLTCAADDALEPLPLMASADSTGATAA